MLERSQRLSSNKLTRYRTAKDRKREYLLDCIEVASERARRRECDLLQKGDAERLPGTPRGPITPRNKEITSTVKEQLLDVLLMIFSDPKSPCYIGYSDDESYVPLQFLALSVRCTAQFEKAPPNLEDWITEIVLMTEESDTSDFFSTKSLARVKTVYEDVEEESEEDEKPILGIRLTHDLQICKCSCICGAAAEQAIQEIDSKLTRAHFLRCRPGEIEEEEEEFERLKTEEENLNKLLRPDVLDKEAYALWEQTRRKAVGMLHDKVELEQTRRDYERELLRVELQKVEAESLRWLWKELHRREKMPIEKIVERRYEKRPPKLRPQNIGSDLDYIVKHLLGKRGWDKVRDTAVHTKLRLITHLFGHLKNNTPENKSIPEPEQTDGKGWDVARSVATRAKLNLLTMGKRTT